VVSTLGGVGEVELLSADALHDGIEDSELSGGEGANHDATSTKTVEAELLEADLLGQGDETAGNGTCATSSGGLVDHGQQGISRVGDDGGGDTSNGTRGQGNNGLGSVAGGLQVVSGGGGDDFLSPALDGELSHGVGDLLEQDGAEARVEALHDTVLLDDLGEGGDEAVGVLGVGHQADTGGLQGAEEDISDKLSHGSGSQVDEGAVVPGLLDSEALSEVDLEELYSAELEPALDEVTHKGRANTGQQSTGAFLSNDLLEGRDHALVVLLGLQLHAGLDDIDGASTAVSDTAANTTGQRSADIVSEAVGLIVVRIAAHGMQT
jgi:hypothetical protein